MMIVSIKRPKTAVQKKSRFVLLAVILTLLLAAGATTAIAASSLISTTVEFDGQSVKVTSFSSDPYEIVEKAGAELNTGDELELENFNADSENSSIVVERAYDVTITDGKNSPVTYRVCGTVADALKKSGITLEKNDSLSCSQSKKITADMSVTVYRAFNVTLKVDGKTDQYEASQGTVSDLLERANVTLSENDTVNFELTDKLESGMKIVVKRITFDSIIETEEIDFEVEETTSNKLYIGQTEITQEGVEGERTNYYVCKYVDGKETERQLVLTKVTKAPVNKVVCSGTKEYPTTAAASSCKAVSSSKVISELTAPYEIKLDSSGRPVNYKKLLTGMATAYSTGTITSTGQSVQPGIIAVDPEKIPYGTKMYIVSSDGKYVYGYCVAGDTGGFIKSGKTIADLYFNTESECVSFGRRSIEIYILE